jgi:hypothetical protein
MSKNTEGMSDAEFYNYQKLKQQEHYKEIMDIRQSANKVRKEKYKKEKNIWGKFKQFFLGA